MDNDRHIESIEIKNFGPLKDVYIPDIKPFTLFIGESASGKSTILKVTALFRYVFKKANIRSYLKDASIKRSPFRINMNRWLKNCGLEGYITNDTKIEYTVKYRGKLYTLTYSNKKLNLCDLIAAEDLSFSKISFISETRSVIPAWLSNVSKNNKASLGFYFHETLSDFDDATNAVNELDLTFLNLRFSVRKDKRGKQYRITPDPHLYSDNYNIELSEASSGIQTSTPLSVITRYFSSVFSFKDAFRRSVLDYLYESDRLKDFQPKVEMTDMQKYVHIHIEEPELSLFPDAQCDLIKFLVKECFLNKHSDGQKLSLMFATHSPYIINYLNVLLRASIYNRENVHLNSENIAVYRVYAGKLQNLVGTDNNTGETVVNTIDLSEKMSEIYQEYINLGKK